MVDVAKIAYKVFLLRENGEQLDITDIASGLNWEENEGELAQRVSLTLANITHKGQRISSLAKPNCYIIVKEGGYSFDATVKGNGAATEGLAAPEKMTPDSAALVWETSKGMITDVAFKDGKITFNASAQNGNALIAVYSADKAIVWSWHIWFPEEEVKTVETKSGYEVMNMNLGAMTSTFGSAPDVKPYGLLYQWGRKDPFPSAPSLTGNEKTQPVPVYGPDGAEVKITYSLWSSVKTILR